MLELTESCDQKAIEENYPDKLTYRGEEFFNGVYINLLNSFADDVIAVESQEVYLGYIPDEDVFIEGYDTWQDEEQSQIPNVCFLKVQGDDVRDVTKKMAKKFNVNLHYGTMMYGRHSVLGHLKSRIPNLLDIRLD